MSIQPTTTPKDDVRPYVRSKDLFFDMQMEKGNEEHPDYRSQEEEEYIFA